MEWLTHSQTGFRQAARYLLGMRLAIITTQLVAITVAESVITLAHRAEALLVCLLYGVLATLGWLWFNRKPPESSVPVSLTLATDLTLIGLWLFYTGGYTNPLVSVLLLPIAVAIILVPTRQSIALTLTGIAVYTALVIWHTPVVHDHHGGDLAQLHLVGMWVTFALTAGILLLVVGTLARRLRHQQSQLSRFRENRLRDEQVIALGLSAAAVAHRLGTPLNTMTLLLDEIRSHSGQGNPELEEDLDMMGQQVMLCSSHLQQLTKTAVEAKTAQLETLPVGEWLARLRESATLLWPSGPIQWAKDHPDGRIAVDATLDQAILNLLANALTASPQWVAVSSRQTDNGRIEIVVEDHGGGLEAALAGAPGEDIVDSRNGLGVGLFLSNATIQRLGGNLKARTGNAGTTMVIDLPQASTPTAGEPEHV
ncbi:sensor histidine kinase [Marinobacter sp. UBA3607]|jgi:two-component system sensor histidine kinase RegB|uniref:sensor histidine kinase n=1 Tax=Marinobacter sp. UBA3607 TaxID=1946820 RepID=UPI000E8A2F85|nr:HAMP domain-containing sensor histidine kinase [Marinobacter sp. UBA3607]HBM51287.1 histidine kinase [Marinobacter sp.]|tara:strand:- start:9135 stop:10409 length:1275 start_codon:yes stop_codon:yes gene_type:complete